jgi:hypothetical protein
MLVKRKIGTRAVIFLELTISFKEHSVMYPVDLLKVSPASQDP